MQICTAARHDRVTVATDSCNDACIHGYCVHKSVGAHENIYQTKIFRFRVVHIKNEQTINTPNNYLVHKTKSILVTQSVYWLYLSRFSITKCSLCKANVNVSCSGSKGCSEVCFHWLAQSYHGISDTQLSVSLQSIHLL